MLPAYAIINDVYLDREHRMLPKPGEKLDLGRWVVSKELVRDYLGAVEDALPIYNETEAAPPMALSAWALGALLNALSLPPGTIHASQELEFKGPVRLGQEVSCSARLSRPMRRGDWQFISAEFILCGEGSEVLLRGKSTVLVPREGVVLG